MLRESAVALGYLKARCVATTPLAERLPRSHAVALLAYQFDSRRAHLEEGEAGVDGEHSDRARLMLLQALWERDPFFVHRTFLLFQSAR